MMEGRRPQAPSPRSGRGVNPKERGRAFYPSLLLRKARARRGAGRLLALDRASLLAMTIAHGCYNDRDLQEEQWKSLFRHSKAKCP